jgi:hypothetical protein
VDETEMTINLLYDFGYRYYQEHPEKRYDNLSWGGFYYKSHEIKLVYDRLKEVEKKLDR